MAKKIHKTISYTTIEAFEMVDTTDGIETVKMDVPLFYGNLSIAQAERVVKKLFPKSTFKVTGVESFNEKYEMDLDYFIEHAQLVTKSEEENI